MSNLIYMEKTDRLFVCDCLGRTVCGKVIYDALKVQFRGQLALDGDHRQTV